MRVRNLDGRAAFADEDVERSRPLGEVGLLTHAAHAHRQQHVGPYDHRAEDFRGDVGAAGVVALEVRDVFLDALDLAVGDVPDGALELSALRAAHQHVHDVTVGPDVLEPAQVFGGLPFAGALAGRRGPRGAAGGG